MSTQQPDYEKRRQNMILQFHLVLARAQHAHTRATTGVYKDRVVHRGDGSKLTQEELLADEMGVAESHLDFAQRILDNLQAAEKT